MALAPTSANLVSAVPSLLEDPDIQSALANAAISTKHCCRTFYPKRFTRPFSAEHDRVFSALDDPNIRKLLIMQPRGTGKTSIVNLGYITREILYGGKKCIIQIGSNFQNISMQSDNLKRELTTNELIVSIWGDLSTDRWSQQMWVTKNGCMVYPRGSGYSGQQVRGIIFGNNRPDLIILDDAESPAEVMNEDHRAQMRQWFYSDVANLVDRARKDWKIVVVGTLLHEDSLLATLEEDPEWTVVKLALCDDMGRSFWPEFMTDEEIAKSRDAAKKMGQLDGWYRENMNQPIATETAMFTQEMFHSYNGFTDEVKLNKDSNVESVVLVDPAKTTGESSCDTAIVGIGIDSDNGRIYVRDIVSAKLHPDQQIEETFAMMERLNSRVIGLEVTSLNEFILHPFKNAMIQRGKYYRLIELKARGGSMAMSKDARINAMSPYYRMGQIYHNNKCCHALEGQLMSHPRSKKKDIMDALAYFIEIMEEGNRYFSPGHSQAETEKEREEEYKALMKNDYAEEDEIAASHALF